MSHIWAIIVVALLLVAAPLPYISTEPTEAVRPELRVQISQEWFLESPVARFAVNTTVQWFEPMPTGWQHAVEGNYTFYSGMRILYFENYQLPVAYQSRTLDTSLPHRVNVTVDITKLDADPLAMVAWEVTAVDDGVGVLFADAGTLYATNESVHINELLIFETPADWICGGCTPDLVAVLAFFAPWWLIAVIVFVAYEAWAHWPRKLRASSPAASSP